jgi:hypothetical protein
MGVKLAAASGGSIELVPTNTASNFTVTVPAVTATMLTTATAGTVLQVVNATFSAAVSNSTSTPTNTGLTATITPTSATSKILVIVDQAGVNKNFSDTACVLQLVRNASLLVAFSYFAGQTNSAAVNTIGGCGINYLDSPATTSSTTYKTQFFSFSNTASASVQVNNETSTITLMEIAA